MDAYNHSAYAKFSLFYVIRKSTLATGYESRTFIVTKPNVIQISSFFYQIIVSFPFCFSRNSILVTHSKDRNFTVTILAGGNCYVYKRSQVGL